MKNVVITPHNSFVGDNVAHRLSTIINSDRILFLNDGKIEMDGTHEELLKNNENYRNLYNKEMESQKA